MIFLQKKIKVATTSVLEKDLLLSSLKSVPKITQ